MTSVNCIFEISRLFCGRTQTRFHRYPHPLFECLASSQTDLISEPAAWAYGGLICSCTVHRHSTIVHDFMNERTWRFLFISVFKNRGIFGANQINYFSTYDINNNNDDDEDILVLNGNDIFFGVNRISVRASTFPSNESASFFLLFKFLNWSPLVSVTRKSCVRFFTIWFINCKTSWCQTKVNSIHVVNSTQFDGFF